MDRVSRCHNQNHPEWNELFVNFSYLNTIGRFIIHLLRRPCYASAKHFILNGSSYTRTLASFTFFFRLTKTPVNRKNLLFSWVKAQITTRKVIHKKINSTWYAVTLKIKKKWVWLNIWFICIFFCGQNIFLKEFRRPRPKDMLQKLSAPCRTEISPCLLVIRSSQALEI